MNPFAAAVVNISANVDTPAEEFTLKGVVKIGGIVNPGMFIPTPIMYSMSSILSVPGLDGLFCDVPGPHTVAVEMVWPGAPNFLKNSARSAGLKDSANSATLTWLVVEEGLPARCLGTK